MGPTYTLKYLGVKEHHFYNLLLKIQKKYTHTHTCANTEREREKYVKCSLGFCIIVALLQLFCKSNIMKKLSQKTKLLVQVVAKQTQQNPEYLDLQTSGFISNNWRNVYFQ